MRIALLAAFFCILSNQVAAQEGANTPRVISPPPDRAAMLDVFPPIAAANGIGGRVDLVCEVAADAHATCSIQQEAPENAGFGAAALRLVDGATFAPRMQNGTPVAGSIELTIAFPARDTPAPIEGPIRVTAIRGAAAVEPLTEEQQRTRHYPQAAHIAEVEGEALVACLVRSTLNVDCAVEREEPAGWGFGARAADIIATAASGHPNQAPGGVTRRRVQFAIRNADQPRAPTFDQSEWSRSPTRAQLRAAYPPAALRAAQEGSVALLCEIRSDRMLQCALLGETPADHGFGAAALEMAALYELRHDVLGRPGRAPGDRILLPVRFEMAR